MKTESVLVHLVWIVLVAAPIPAAGQGDDDAESTPAVEMHGTAETAPDAEASSGDAAPSGQAEEQPGAKDSPSEDKDDLQKTDDEDAPEATGPRLDEKPCPPLEPRPPSLNLPCPQEESGKTAQTPQVIGNESHCLKWRGFDANVDTQGEPLGFGTHRVGTWGEAYAIDQIARPDAVPIGSRLLDSAQADDTRAEHRYIVYRRPARFELTGFDRHGIGAPEATAVIYEGMAIRVEADGRFTVRFLLETPQIKTIVRLQFTVFDHARGTPRALGTITLPPLEFDPDTTRSHSGRSVVWKAEQSGYSPILQCLGEYGGNPCSLEVQRHGVAQFGSIPSP